MKPFSTFSKENLYNFYVYDSDAKFLRKTIGEMIHVWNITPDSLSLKNKNILIDALISTLGKPSQFCDDYIDDIMIEIDMNLLIRSLFKGVNDDLLLGMEITDRLYEFFDPIIEYLFYCENERYDLEKMPKEHLLNNPAYDAIYCDRLKISQESKIAA